MLHLIKYLNTETALDFNIKVGLSGKQNTNCLLLAVFESSDLPETSKKIDQALAGSISKVIKLGDMRGELGQILVLHNAEDIGADRVMLVGCGKANEFNTKNFREAMQKAAHALHSLDAKNAICCITELPIAHSKYDITWAIRQAVVIVTSSGYKFDEYKSKTEKSNKKHKPSSLDKVTFIIADKRDLAAAEQGVKFGMALATGLKLTKDLANTPPNVCNPTYLAKTAIKLATKYKSISTAVLERKDMQTLKMGAFLSVAQGSPQPPKLITLEYRGAAKTKQPVVLVGKGITFDTGGNSLKSPPDKMVGMKYDMCGAASVLGVIVFAAELGLEVNIVGVLAAAENMPGGEASRPEDVVTTMSGLTVEILNTDAEGRLVLCDALTYCERFNPKVVIDIATLTGACVIALGNHHAGLFANHQPLADNLLAAGIASDDKCWQMPLTDEYMKQLETNFADLANVGGAEAGSITAACFLSRFTKKYNWAHLDVAGTACRFTGKERGATGQPVRMLAEYIINEIG